MFDTNVTIVGNVLTAPEWRRTTQTGTLVASFRVASTARRLDRESGRWVDGNSLRVRVTCWRRLAEGVASSVMVGDPVIVVGRMYTRDWTDDAGNHRTTYEVEAVAVGHDLSRGRGRFARNRPTPSTSAPADAETESRVHGEATESVSTDEAPALPDDRPFHDEDDGGEDSRYDAGRGLPVPRDPAPGGPDHELTASPGVDGRADGGEGGRPGDGLPVGEAPIPGGFRDRGRPDSGVTDVPVPDDGARGNGRDGAGDGGEAGRADGRATGGRGRRNRVAVPA